MDDAEALVDLAKQYNYNGLLGTPRIDLLHKGRREFFSNRPHVHIGPINHIKIIGYVDIWIFNGIITESLYKD